MIRPEVLPPSLRPSVFVGLGVVATFALTFIVVGMFAGAVGRIPMPLVVVPASAAPPLSPSPLMTCTAYDCNGITLTASSISGEGRWTVVP